MKCPAWLWDMAGQHRDSATGRAQQGGAPAVGVWALAGGLCVQQMENLGNPGWSQRSQVSQFPSPEMG